MLTQSYGQRMADFLLKQHWQIDRRVSDVLEIATGQRLSANAAVNKAWLDNVNQPRTRLSHGKRLSVGPDEVDKARQAVCRAIQWIEGLKPAALSGQ